MDTFLIVGHFLLYMFDIALFAPIIYKIGGSLTQKLFRIKKISKSNCISKPNYFTYLKHLNYLSPIVNVKITIPNNV